MWQSNAARNPHTPQKVLRDLALNPSVEVRYEVARNPSTHPTTIDDLTKDKDRNVRFAAFTNPSISSETLIYFIDNGSPITSSMATKMLQKRQDSKIDFKYNLRKEFDMKKFWSVFRGDCHNFCGVYGSKEEAIKVAKRLTVRENAVHVVMAPIKAFDKPEPNVVEVELED